MGPKRQQGNVEGLFVAESHRLAVFPWPLRCAERLPFHNISASIDYGFKANC